MRNWEHGTRNNNCYIISRGIWPINGALNLDIPKRTHSTHQCIKRIFITVRMGAALQLVHGQKSDKESYNFNCNGYTSDTASSLYRLSPGPLLSVQCHPLLVIVHLDVNYGPPTHNQSNIGI
jgi:hypothetical protein